MKKRIAIVTSTRADWGLLKPLADQFKSSDWTEPLIFATGTHFLESFGSTYQYILKDGYQISERIDSQLFPNSAASVSKSLALTAIGFADVFQRNRPDLTVILGDRYEILAVAVAAANERIPIAHLHGGEQTEGALDESYRHAITKFATFHFTSCETYRKRVIQLGEDPKRVFNAGAIGIDNILRMPYASKDELSNLIQRNLADRQYALITFHPETTASEQKGKKQLETFLSALESFPETLFLFTLSNADLGGLSYNARIREFCEKSANRIAVKSLGNYYYLAAIRGAAFVLGNSSSGIIEVPYFHVPTVNVGDRQKGRLAPESVIHCPAERDAIIAAIRQTQQPDFLRKIQTMTQIYGDGHAAEKIASILREKLITDEDSENLNRKPFFDLP